MTPHTVLFFGGSLLLSLVADSLAACPDLRVVRAPTWTQASHALAERPPDVLIFDLANSCESHILPLLIKHPNLRLIGPDPESNRAVMLASRGADSLTLHQLQQIVQREASLSGEPL